MTDEVGKIEIMLDGCRSLNWLNKDEDALNHNRIIMVTMHLFISLHLDPMK